MGHIFSDWRIMYKFKTVFLILVLFALSSKIYSNDFSFEANYIFKNTVEISRIDSFFFKGNHSFEEKIFVAHTLFNYKNENAKNLFLKMLKDSRVINQSIAILPLINLGEFQIAFIKFKEIILQNNEEALISLYYQNTLSDYTNRKLALYKEYKKEFIPFFKEICKKDSISYSIKKTAGFLKADMQS